ncbi:MAG: cell division protein FtsQ/DivIB [Candidatus Omnitrophota bacterium]
MKKQKPSSIPVKLIGSIIVVLVCVFIIGSLWKGLKNRDYFRIKDIIANGFAADVSYLKGRNIFEIDLNKEAEYLVRTYPCYKIVKLIRILPNRLFLRCLKRQPLAYVKLYRYFYVDSNSVIFNADNQVIDADLPVILGLEAKIFSPKDGKNYNDVKELGLALDIIKSLSLNKGDGEYKIKKIDASNLVNASFYLCLEGNDFLLEVRTGHEHIGDKINILSSLLAQMNKERFNIKYIDLRFKEPVIKFRDK